LPGAPPPFLKNMLFFPDCSIVIQGTSRLVAGAPRFFQACHRHSQAWPWLSEALLGAPKVLYGALRYFQTYPNHSHGSAVNVISDSSYTEGRQKCPSRVWYSPQIDASKLTLHIISDSPGGFQWLKYILLMSIALNLIFTANTFSPIFPNFLSSLPLTESIPSKVWNYNPPKN